MVRLIVRLLLLSVPLTLSACQSSPVSSAAHHDAAAIETVDGMSEKVDPEYERHRDIPLSLLVPSVERAADGREFINRSDAPRAHVLLDRTLVIFSEMASPRDMEKFLHDFDAEVTERLTPDSKNVRVEFDLQAIKLDRGLTAELARAEGYNGEIEFSSLCAAKLLQVFCLARKHKDKYNIFGVGMAFDADVE